MNLGERICSLRTQKGMSQGDLAEALDVSRQSISKWETGASVPELDKLIKLSQLFGVTLDELVLDKQPVEAPPPPEPKVIYVEKQAPRSGKQTGGILLLCFAALTWLLCTLLGDTLAGLVLASPFIACGLILLLIPRNTGLWCLWVVFCFVDLYLRFATGVNLRFVFIPRFYDGSWTIQLIVAWAMLAIFAVLSLVTVLRFRHTPAGSAGKSAIGAAISWAAYCVIHIALVLPFRDPTSNPGRALSSFVDWLRSMVFATALTFTVRLITALWMKRKTQEAQT